ncbi:site-specific integrase, partial [Faecalibaculum rodentium]
MGKIKDPQLFLLIKNFLLVYLPVQRKLSGNTVTTYRTVLNQFLAHVAGAEGIPVMAVTFDMVNAGSVNAYLDSLTGDRGLSSSTRNNRLAVL